MLEIIYDIFLLSMVNEEQTIPTPETQPAPQEPAQPVTQMSETPKQKSWMVIGLTMLILILLGTTGFFAYQNYQLKKQVVQKQSTPLPEVTKKPEIPSPTPTDSSDRSWETYSSESIGISLEYPQNDILQEPQLEAILSINYSGNRYINSELQDGYALSILYTPIDANTTSAKERANTAKDFESERCTTSAISTSEIDRKEAYLFTSTDCTYDTILYFVRGNTHQYEIRTEHNGDIAKYREITKKIVESIKFL